MSPALVAVVKGAVVDHLHSRLLRRSVAVVVLLASHPPKSFRLERTPLSTSRLVRGDRRLVLVGLAAVVPVVSDRRVPTPRLLVQVSVSLVLGVLVGQVGQPLRLV